MSIKQKKHAQELFSNGGVLESEPTRLREAQGDERRGRRSVQRGVQDKIEIHTGSKVCDGR